MRTPLLGVLALLAPGVALAAASGSEPEALARARAVLEPSATKQQLSSFLGQPPFACAVVAKDRVICNWSLGKRDPAWSALAESVPTDDRINVVCELPADESARAPEACSVHPRRSNRYRWKPSEGGAKKRMKNRWNRETSEQRRERASALLEVARTPLEVSRLVGQGPSECTDSQPGLRRCTWHATARTLGHGTLAMVIEASVHKKIRMQCVFPDAGPRAPDSCSVAIGAEP